MPQDKIPTKIHFPQKFTTVIEERTAIKGSLTAQRTNTITCWTDGSKLDTGYSGSGVLINSQTLGDISWYTSLGKYTTVFQAEIHAILTCANYVAHNNITHHNITINTDSQASIKALAQYKQTSKMVRQCNLAINNIASNNLVTLKWVPGHSNIEGNEKADTLAKRGSSIIPTGPEPILPIANCTIKSILNNQAKKDHNKKWTSRTDCRQARETMPLTCAKRTRMILSLRRQELKNVTAILSGHCNLNKHMFITKMSNTPVCPKCNLEEETPTHHLGVCPIYQRLRQKYIPLPINVPYDISKCPIKNIAQFLTNTSRLKEIST